MGAIVRRIIATITFDVEFEGPGVAKLDFVPQSPGDDELVRQLLAKNDALILAEIKSAGPALEDGGLV